MSQLISDSEQTVWNRLYLPLVLTLLYGVIFLFLTVLTSSASELSLPIRLTIVIPEIAIWVIAALGAFKLKRYSYSIRQHKDGQGLEYISNALLLMVIYIMILTTAGSYVTLLADTKYLRLAVVLKNHIPLLVALASTILLLKGAVTLCKIAGSKVWNRNRYIVVTLSTFLFFVAFAYAFNQSDPTKISVDGIPRFALPVSVLLFSYILPHVVMWFLGAKAIIHLADYSHNVPGSVYKSLFINLCRGIKLTFISIFAAQFFIVSTISMSISGPILGAVYLILIIATIGFLLILRGVRQLNKIES